MSVCSHTCHWLCQVFFVISREPSLALEDPEKWYASPTVLSVQFVRCNTVQYSTVLCCTVHYRTWNRTSFMVCWMSV